MKITLTLTLIFTTLFLNAQSSIFIETGVSSLGSNNHIGFQYVKPQSKVGVYFTLGGNYMDRFIGINNDLISDSKGDFTSTVSWYTKDGSYYQTMPSTPIFTSVQWGNSLIETGNCVNTVETWSGKQTSKVKIYNVGVTINGGKNVNYRIGLGIRNLKQSGYFDYNYWKNSFTVSKYYDEWGVIAQPSGMFVVVGSGEVSERDETKYISVNKTEFNLNLAVEYTLQNNTTISLGYNTKGGINLGVGYMIK